MSKGIPFVHFWPPEVKREVVRIIWSHQDGRCAYCLKLMNLVDRPPKDQLDATIDHIVPIARGGGKLHVWNMVLACNLCNKTKQDKFWTPKLPIAYGEVDFPPEAVDDFDLCD